MWSRQAVLVFALAAAVSLSCGLGSAKAQVCDDGQNGGIGPIDTAVTADLLVPSDVQCHIGPTGSVAGDILVDGQVSGDLKHRSGEVFLRGRLYGNIEAATDGSIVISGIVRGNIENTGNGNVGIRRGGRISGNVKLLGDGDLTLDAGSLVGGDVEMEGTGKVTIGAGSTVDGNIKCGPNGGALKGVVNGTVKGKIECK